MGGVVKKVVSKTGLGTILGLDKKKEKPKEEGGTSYSQEDMDEAMRRQKQRRSGTGRKAEVSTTLTRSDTLG